MHYDGLVPRDQSKLQSVRKWRPRSTLSRGATAVLSWTDNWSLRALPASTACRRPLTFGIEHAHLVQPVPDMKTTELALRWVHQESWTQHRSTQHAAPAKCLGCGVRQASRVRAMSRQRSPKMSCPADRQIQEHALQNRSCRSFLESVQMEHWRWVAQLQWHSAWTPGWLAVH
jgi:hypothetical protein